MTYDFSARTGSYPELVEELRRRVEDKCSTVGFQAFDSFGAKFFGGLDNEDASNALAEFLGGSGSMGSYLGKRWYVIAVVIVAVIAAIVSLFFAFAPFGPKMMYAKCMPKAADEHQLKSSRYGSVVTLVISCIVIFVAGILGLIGTTHATSTLNDSACNMYVSLYGTFNGADQLLGTDLYPKLSNVWVGTENLLRIMDDLEQYAQYGDKNPVEQLLSQQKAKVDQILVDAIVEAKELADMVVEHETVFSGLSAMNRTDLTFPVITDSTNWVDQRDPDTVLNEEDYVTVTSCDGPGPECQPTYAIHSYPTSFMIPGTARLARDKTVKFHEELQVVKAKVDAAFTGLMEQNFGDSSVVLPAAQSAIDNSRAAVHKINNSIAGLVELWTEVEPLLSGLVSATNIFAFIGAMCGMIAVIFSFMGVNRLKDPQTHNNYWKLSFFLSAIGLCASLMWTSLGFTAAVVGSDACAFLEDVMDGQTSNLPEDILYPEGDSPVNMRQVFDACVNTNGHGNVAAVTGLQGGIDRVTSLLTEALDATVDLSENMLDKYTNSLKVDMITKALEIAYDDIATSYVTRSDVSRARVYGTIGDIIKCNVVDIGGGVVMRGGGCEVTGYTTLTPLDPRLMAVALRDWDQSKVAERTIVTNGVLTWDYAYRDSVAALFELLDMLGGMLGDPMDAAAVTDALKSGASLYDFDFGFGTDVDGNAIWTDGKGDNDVSAWLKGLVQGEGIQRELTPIGSVVRIANQEYAEIVEEFHALFSPTEETRTTGSLPQYCSAYLSGKGLCEMDEDVLDLDTFSFRAIYEKAMTDFGAIIDQVSAEEKAEKPSSISKFGWDNMRYAYVQAVSQLRLLNYYSSVKISELASKSGFQLPEGFLTYLDLTEDSTFEELRVALGHANDGVRSAVKSLFNQAMSSAEELIYDYAVPSLEMMMDKSNAALTNGNCQFIGVSMDDAVVYPICESAMPAVTEASVMGFLVAMGSGILVVISSKYVKSSKSMADNDNQSDDTSSEGDSPVQVASSH